MCWPHSTFGMQSSVSALGEAVFHPQLLMEVQSHSICSVQALGVSQSHGVAAGLAQTKKFPLPKDYLLPRKSTSGGTCQTQSTRRLFFIAQYPFKPGLQIIAATAKQHRPSHSTEPISLYSGEPFVVQKVFGRAWLAAHGKKKIYFLLDT